MITKIDHVAIAVRRLEQQLPFWAEALGLDVEGMETVEAEQVKVAFLAAGTSRIELLEPTTDESTVARFLERRGEGIHHLTFEVRDLQQHIGRLREHGVELLGNEARLGAGGRPIAFLHPRSSGGVLVELVETTRHERGSDDIRPGSCVLAYLRDPVEKLWGVLRRLDGAGAVVEAIDLASFDDWIAQVERSEESVVGPSVLFVPMGRLEKILLDRPSGNLPSLADRFEQRTGRTVQQVLTA
jgi:methylmalonyl-CoA/ethylmalonyl-CoA epimerase